MIKEYLKKNILITDGAMGTYYAQLTGKYSMPPEFANISEPEIIERIHSEYITAGAKLIKTNTFSANSSILNIPMAEVKKIIIAGIKIANQAAGNKNIFVAASIGPIPETAGATDADQGNLIDEYKVIVDVFLSMDIKIFFFETFSDTGYLKEIANYIKKRDGSVFVSAQFATTPEGFTRKGISNSNIVADVRQCASIDAYGFNCGVGPTHLYNSLKGLIFADDIVAIAPNAGYPEVINERTVYIQNPGYFAEKMLEISRLGVKILGGCCGTTPVHIEKMVELIQPLPEGSFEKQAPVVKPASVLVEKKPEGFYEKMKAGKFVVAVELDPPFNADSEKILQNARVCKEHGVDVITIADSPMARARVDSVIIAAKIQREVGIEVMPHICCRDKNLNALKSALLAGYIENIRNILAVTGDPVSLADKNEIKGVFNLNSFTLMELVTNMNKEVFVKSPINVGGALDLNVPNPGGELSRMLKKSEMGCTFFLTQPLFDDKVLELLPQIKKRESVKVLGGIMPLVSYRNAQYLNNEVAGIKIPERIIARFDRNMEKNEAENLGIEIAVDIARRIRDNVHGYYFITPFNRVEVITKIMKELNL